MWGEVATRNTLSCDCLQETVSRLRIRLLQKQRSWLLTGKEDRSLCLPHFTGAFLRSSVHYPLSEDKKFELNLLLPPRLWLSWRDPGSSGLLPAEHLAHKRVQTSQSAATGLRAQEGWGHPSSKGHIPSSAPSREAPPTRRSITRSPLTILSWRLIFFFLILKQMFSFPFRF